jgi:hypothetical protein
MDFAISEKMQTILAMIDEFMAKELIPLEKAFLSGDMQRLWCELEEKRALVKQMELWDLFEGFVAVLCELPRLDHRKVGLADLGRPRGYVRCQVLGWSRRYRVARTPDMPDFEPVMAWLEEKMPPDTDRAGLIHNDFKLDNIVLDPTDPLESQGGTPPKLAILRLCLPGHIDGRRIALGDGSQFSHADR